MINTLLSASWDDPNTRILFIVLLVLLILGIIAIVLIPLLIKNKKNKAIKKEEEIFNNSKDEILLYLGNKENIIEYSLNGSRLTLKLNNYDLLNKEELKKFGVERFLKMENKIILVGKEVYKIFNLISK